MKTILITGGAGFIGTNVAKRFLDEGYHVIAFDNLSRRGVQDNLKWLEKNYQDKFKFIWGDLRNNEDFYPLYSLATDVVFIVHAGAQPGIPYSFDNPRYDVNVNSIGTLNVLEFARTHGKIPTAFMSTNKVYADRINELPLKKSDKRYIVDLPNYNGNDENGVLDAGGDGYSHSVYGVNKIFGDQLYQEYFAAFDIPTVVNRCSCITGLHAFGVSEQGWVSFMVREIFRPNPHFPVFGDGYQVRDVLDGRDLAELFYQEFIQLEKCKGKVFNIGGGSANTISLLEAIDFIESKTGRKFQLSFHNWRRADHKYYCSSIERAKKILNWSPAISIEQTLNDMINETQNV